MIQRTPAQHMLALLAALVLLAAVTGCAAPSPATATSPQQTFNARADKVLAAADVLTTSARALLAADKITPDQADGVATLVEATRGAVLLAMARGARAGPAAAIDDLQAAEDALRSLQEYLARAPKAKPAAEKKPRAAKPAKKTEEKP